MEIIHNESVHKNLSIRKADSHKGNYGKLLLVAGSVGMAGAAVLAARGAYSAGAGVVFCAVPEPIYPILQISVPEAICIPKEHPLPSFETYDAIIIGPGLGTQRNNAELIDKVLTSYEGSLVLDADGLNCIVKYGMQQALQNTEAKVVITPHPGEAKRLLAGCDETDREATVASLASRFGVTAVLKGNETLVASRETGQSHNIHKNPTGNPGMATAGSGDVLAGVIGAFLGMGMTSVDAATTGVYIHGAAGDLAAMELGEYGMMASDICSFVPYAIRNITGK